MEIVKEQIFDYTKVKLESAKSGKFMLAEERGKYFFKDSATVALKNFQDLMTGEAENAGFCDPDDVVKFIKYRRKVR